MRYSVLESIGTCRSRMRWRVSGDGTKGEEETLRGRALLVSLLVVAVLVPAAAANAPIRQHFTFSDFTFPDAYLSDACGTEILSTIGGTFDVRLFVDTTGSAVSEVDTVTRGTIVWTNPDNDASVSSIIAAMSHAVYPDGIVVGARAPTRISGTNAAAITGVAPPGNGTIVVDAEIVFVDPEGVPFTAFDTGDIVSMNGNFERRTAELCDALTS